jgi:glycerol-3-phosphate acyltransferase PlsX
MPPKVKIGIDLSGSENSPESLLAAIRSLAAGLSTSIELILIGPDRLACHDLPYIAAHETIGMDDAPIIIRRKKRSPLWIGLDMLRKKKIDAFVSAGHTGALVLGAKTMLGMIPPLLRPALLALMPTKQKPIAVLDIGANVRVRAEHLVQFAFVGAAYQRSRGVELPAVGLLNIGSEAMKGTSEIRLAYQKLSQEPHPLFSFAGNIEGKDAFNGHVDVLVTDGFTGNVFLKTAEGMANLAIDCLPDDQIKEPLSHLSYAEYPGALLAGVQGVVIKCHGYSSPQAFVNGIREAIRIVKTNLIKNLAINFFLENDKSL